MASPSYSCCCPSQQQHTQPQDSSQSQSQPQPQQSSHLSYRKWILYGYCLVSVSLTAGVVYGWPALRHQLLQEEEDRSSSLSLSESALGAAFTAGAWSTQGCRLLTGLLRDCYGCRRVCISIFVCVAAGFVGLAAWSGDAASNSGIFPLAVSLFVVGLGSGVQLCLQPVAAGLFAPSSSGSILASLSGAFQVSGLVFLVLTKIAPNNRRLVFSIFSVVVLLLAVAAIPLLPTKTTTTTNSILGRDSVDDKPAEPRSPATCVCSVNDKNEDQASEPRDKAEELMDEPSSTTQNTRTSAIMMNKQDKEEQPLATQNSSSNSNNINKNNRKRRLLKRGISISSSLSTSCSSSSCLHDSRDNVTLKRQILSAEYALLVTWFSLNVTPMQYYIGSLGFQLEEQGDESGFYANLFSVLYASSAALSPAVGALADQGGSSIGLVQGLASLLSATSLFVLAAAPVTTLRFQVVGLACNGIGRMCLYGMFFAHVGKRFGYQHYGTLAGLGLLLSAIVSLLQYPLISAAAGGYAVAVNVAGGVTLLATLPYCAWLFSKERREIIQQQQHEQESPPLSLVDKN